MSGGLSGESGDRTMYDADDTHRVAVRAASTLGEEHPAASTAQRRAERAARLRAASRGHALSVTIPRRAAWQLAAALVVLVTAVALILVALLRDGSVSTTRDVPFPATPPAEWATRARWRTPPLLPKSGPALVVGQDRVAVITAERTLLLIDAASGDTLWTADVPAGQLSTNLALTTIDGQLVIAAQVGDGLCWWGVDDGTPAQLALPPGARATFLGSAPLIGTGPSTVATVRDAALVTTDVPPGATALAARSDGVITAAAPAGWWHLQPESTAGPPQPWESISASPISPTVISYSFERIITVLPGKPVRILVFSDRNEDVRFSFGGAIATENTATQPLNLTWYPSPSATWGILSRTLIDLTRGRIVDLGDWTTRHVASDRALGTISSTHALVGPQIPRGQLVGGESFPEDLTTSGALVRSRENGSEMLYLLPSRIG